MYGNTCRASLVISLMLSASAVGSAQMNQTAATSSGASLSSGSAVLQCATATAGVCAPAPLVQPPSSQPGAAAVPVNILDGSAPLYLSEAQAHGFVYSASVSSGYDSAVNDVPHLGGAVTNVEGYLGSLWHKRSFNLLLQHDSSFTDSSSTNLGRQQYQRSAVSLTGVFSRKTSWSFTTENGFGSDAARAVGNLNSAVVGPLAIPGRDVTALGLNSGNVLSTHAIVGMEHQTSASKILDVNLGGFYHRFFDSGSSNQQVDLSARYRDQVSVRTSVGGYTQLVQENYSAAHCTTGSVGFTVSSALLRSAQLEASAGPAFGSSRCSGGGDYQFNASLTAALPHTAIMYVAGGRQRSDGLIQEATWESSVFAGGALGQQSHTRIRVDGGLARYTLVQRAWATAPLHGAFVSGEFHRRLSSAFEISATARHLTRSPGAAQLNRNLAFVTLTWSPARRTLHSSFVGGDNAGR